MGTNSFQQPTSGDCSPLWGLQSDCGIKFTSQITQLLTKAFNIPWHFHTPCHPQGKVERTNHILKNALTKLYLKLHLAWTKLLPLSLLCMRTFLKKPLNILPFELMYGRPLVPPATHSQSPLLLPQLLSSLLKYLRRELWKYTDTYCPAPGPTTSDSLPPVTVRGEVYLSSSRHSLSSPPTKPQAKWTRPYRVILTTPTAANLQGTPTGSTSPTLSIPLPHYTVTPTG